MKIVSRNYPAFVEGRRGKQVDYCEVAFTLKQAEISSWTLRILPQGILKLKYNELEAWRGWEEIAPHTYRNPIQCFSIEELSGRYPIPAYFDQSVQTSGVIPYQNGILRWAMSQANHLEGNILEVGTRFGHSASIIAQAAPMAKLLTIEPYEDRVAISKENLAKYSNITVVHGKSWDYLKAYQGPQLDAVFIDGNHRYVGHDTPWYQWLKPGGVILFHDWTSMGCWHVVEAIEKMSCELKRRSDIEIMDTDLKGMAGFYKHD